MTTPKAVGSLYREIRAVLEEARSTAHRAVNTAMVQAYWNVGRLIIEHEQGGKRRAGYGEALLEGLSRSLTAEFGRGFDVTNLRKMRQFYRMFEIRDAVRLGLQALPSSAKQAAPRPVSGRESIRLVASESLSWSHYRLLMQVAAPAAREWYMSEAASQHWSSRQLDRQIAALYHERLLASRRKAPVRKEAREKLARIEPEQFIRDPYVLGFLDLPDDATLRESKLEQAIIDNLQAFLLELGKGFSFVARQKRIRFEEEDFYVDLVFYNYFLKCFVLVDLKVGALTHQDIGRMDGCVRVFDEQARPEGDNPTIGLILCSQKNDAIARYSVLSEGKRLFAAKYVKVLPTEAELTRAIRRERRLVDGRSHS
jgi:predicted nuclease of restriction endonuclease-like (RecB) superfamily